MEAKEMAIKTESFGNLKNGTPINCYILNAHGMKCKVSQFGGAIVSLMVHDKNGNDIDVVTGFDDVSKYEMPCGCMGFTIGRYGNRIANGEFLLEGKKYTLAKNNGVNHLHGGAEKPFHMQVFNASFEKMDDNDVLCLSLDSPDGEEGYPGNVHVEVRFSIVEPCKLVITYTGTTDKTTILNMTNHSYFNLDGHQSGDVRNHTLQVNADFTTEVKEGLIPTGKLAPVANTAFDLRKAKKIADVLKATSTDPQMIMGGGLDHNFCMGNDKKDKLAAILYSPNSGIKMETYTDQPGVQVYTACTTDIKGGKDGAYYGKYCACALETQHYPDSPNNLDFPSVVLKPDETYNTKTEYSFSLE